MKKFAYSLAEVLITLGIIGVVAALTIPSTISQYNKKVWTTSLKKAYSTATQACNQALANDEVDYIGDTEFLQSLSTKTNFESVAKKYFTNAEIKKLTASPADYRGKRGDNYFPSGWSNYYEIKLPNETLYINGTISSGSPENSQLEFYVDVNGANKKPNIAGKDFFGFNLDKRCKYKPYFSSASCSVSHYFHFYGSAYACFDKIINDGWEIKDGYLW